MDAIRAIDICSPGWPEHRGVAPRRSDEAVGGRIVPSVSFRFDNDPADTLHEQGHPNEVSCDRDRIASKEGEVQAFTGGLIGDKLYRDNYQGDFKQTPVFIGSSDPDAHIPVERVHETTKTMQAMNAIVHEKIYPQMGHTIAQDEIEVANRLIFNSHSAA